MADTTPYTCKAPVYCTFCGQWLGEPPETVKLRLRAEKAEAEVKALQAAMANRGDFLWMDLTPGPDLAVRILQAYRRQCDERMEATPPSELIDMMNAWQGQRAEILDHAIAVLVEFEPKLKRCEERQVPRPLTGRGGLKP